MAPQLANTQASCSKQAAQATPKGLLACFVPVRETHTFAGDPSLPYNLKIKRRPFFDRLFNYYASNISPEALRRGTHG